MQSKNRTQLWSMVLGSTAAALLLLGGTALADPPCYACTSGCTSTGVNVGWGSVDANGQPIVIGGGGFGVCGPGTQCFASVLSYCQNMCTTCTANGGDPTGIVLCSDARCSDRTGLAGDGVTVTSVCSNICLCATSGYCTEVIVVPGGIWSIQNVKCDCPH